MLLFPSCVALYAYKYLLTSSNFIRVVYKLPIGRVRLVVHIVTPKFVRSLVRPTRPFVRSPVLVENRRIFPNTVQVVPL